MGIMTSIFMPFVTAAAGSFGAMFGAITDLCIVF